MLAWVRRIHAVVGLALCLLLALIALTGASMVFEPQLRGRPGVAPAHPSPAALSVVMQTAEARFGADQVRSVVFASPIADRHEVRVKDGEGVWIDASGRKALDFGWVDRLFETLFAVHHQLLSGDTGEAVVGWVGVTGVLMALSGLALWWPARQSFKGVFIPRRGGRAGWLAAHRDLAVMVAPMVILTMITGAGMALPDLFRPAFQAAAPKAPRLAEGAAPARVDWAAGLKAAQARFPQADIRMAVAPGKPGQAASIRLRQPGEWHANGRTIVYLRPATGDIIGVYDAQAQGAGARAFNGFWPVHAARVGGVIWQVIVLFGGLSLAALSLFGGEAYRRKLFRRKPRAASPA